MCLFPYAVFAALLLAAAAASASAKLASFLTAAAHECAIGREPSGRLLRVRQTRHPLQATSHDESAVAPFTPPFTHLEAATERLAGEVGPPPTDEELLQWVADGEAALAEFMEGRPPGAPPDENLKSALTRLYVLMLSMCRQKDLDVSYRPKVYDYALADLADSGELSQLLADVGQLDHKAKWRVHDDEQLRKRLDKAEAELASFRCEVNELKKRLQASEPPSTAASSPRDDQINGG
ncbi:unnamed protein product [Vitrella brassicaformis CCMP3155]|uniref:Endoplasmic reticulum transmembrane protein n=1 Tax=Vitrella brassicaformis (strain CCMP3155) TaxID=1169540 RepID=A0A0G4EE48_VITBC|nr:unnamed protein product [Vitrella brassicaformis CCMP3155]|eukprot:CEL93614.1 unnamed protein product [Vitrella brassicaformis CCMP3155]